MSDVWDTDIIHFIASFNSVSVIPNIFILFFCLLCLKGYFYLKIKIQLSSSYTRGVSWSVGAKQRSPKQQK